MIFNLTASKPALISLFCLLSSMTLPAQDCRLSETYANTLCQEIYLMLGGKGKAPVVFFKTDDNYASSSVVGGKAQIHIDPDKIISVFEKKFGVDCSSTDADDALAVILGHEIWHIINKKHGIRFGFWGPQDYQTRNLELEADLHGLIGAYFAGKTRCLTIYPDIFNALRLSNRPNYPPVADRQRMVTQVRERAESQFRLYDAANCLLAANRRDAQMMAISTYQHIGNRFQFLKEINFNMGLANLLLALGDLNTGLLFPIEPAANPLTELVARASGGGVRNTEKLLEDAESLFREAQQQDGDYFEAWLGETSIQLLRHAHDPQKRGYAFNVFALGATWRKSHPEVQLSAAQNHQLKMLEALAYLLQTPAKESAKAVSILRDIENSNAPGYLREYARYNRRRADTNAPKETAATPIMAPKLSETDGISHDVADVYSKFSQENGWVSLDENLNMYQTSLEKSDLVFFQEKRHYVGVQLYHKCPASVGKTLTPVKKNTSPGNYRYLEGESYDLVTWMEPDGVARCAKILRVK